MTRGPAASLAGVAGIVLAVEAVAVPLPDLAVPREDLGREGDSIHAVVENRGPGASPASVLELWDRPPLQGTTGTSTPYPFVPNQNGVWVFQEPAGPNTVAVTLAIGHGRTLAAGPGSFELIRGERILLVDPPPGVSVGPAGRSVRWDAPEAPLVLPLRVVAGAGDTPAATIRLRESEPGLLPRVLTHRAEYHNRSVPLSLDCLERVPARTARLPVPALQPGERVTLRARFAGGALGEVIAWVDPDDALPEVREGNNAAAWKEDRDGTTLAALHLHSCFSEGPGSVDWQAYLASLSGYDLLWWSEHDWRISCFDHLEHLGFEEGEGLDLDFTTAGDATTAEVATGMTAAGEQALRLEVAGREGGRASCHLASRRRRLGYTLASRVGVTMRVFARNLDADDRLRVLVELSHHPGGARRLEYDFRWEGSPGGRETGAPPGLVPRTLPTGGWVTVTLPLSRDAESAWANGLDDNIMALGFELESAGSGASVLVDEIEVSHERCGDALREVQEKWLADYPNLAHLLAEEVSYGKPHLNQYGGRRGLMDYARAWEEQYVETVVRRVHDSDGIVSWCHPFGVRSSPAVRKRYRGAYRDSLLAVGIGGTDVLEVGFRKKAMTPLHEYLAFWDEAGRRGIAITGIGVNDSHGVEWASWENNFATWVAAPAGDAKAMLRAIRTGHVFFGDPLRFRGRLELAAGSAAAGDIVVGSAPREVTVRLVDAPPGTRVRLMADGVPRREWSDLTGTVELHETFVPGETTVVRAELWGPGRTPLAFTNPLYLDPEGRIRRGGP